MGILLIQGLVKKWKCFKEKRAENKESLSCDNSVLEREAERQGANQQWRREENLERFHSDFLIFRYILNDLLASFCRKC